MSILEAKTTILETKKAVLEAKRPILEAKNEDDSGKTTKNHEEPFPLLVLRPRRRNAQGP